jgi:hypothetical protein
MNISHGHFDLITAEALYDKATHDYLIFFDKPDSWALFDVLASFTHLLEWICPEANGKEPVLAFASGTREQQFYYQMWNRTSYKQIRALCNNSKHFHHKRKGPTTSVIVGATVGLARAGDALGQTYFMVDGKDIRAVLMDVYIFFKQYFDWEPRDI